MFAQRKGTGKALIDIQNLTKVFADGSARVVALEDVSLRVENGEVFETLPLPIMGLMSDAGFESVNETLGRMIKKAHEMGVPADIEPFITLSFLALPVIPTLRITPRGLCLLTAKGPEILQE